MPRTWSARSIVHRVLKVVEPSQRGADVKALQVALNKRARHRGLPQVTVDGVFGRQTSQAAHDVAWALGAYQPDLDRPGFGKRLQRIVRYPATRTPAQLARARKRQEEIARRSKLIRRADWGARPPRSSYTPTTKQRVVIHHTAALARVFKSAAAERLHMRVIQGWHFTRGFIDIGYQRVVFPSGRVYEGRPLGTLGAGVTGHNTGSVHYSLAGNFEIEKPTRAALDAVSRQMTADGTADLTRYGHYQLQPNACPGRHMKPHVQDL